MPFSRPLVWPCICLLQLLYSFLGYGWYSLLGVRLFCSSVLTVQLVTTTYIMGTATDLLNVFETFLPQLLLYPNPTDPLNGEAAALLMKEPEAYAAKVRGT